jgi:uroporphyrinogen decarboxylase
MKAEKMSAYERVMTALDGGKPDRVPAFLFMRDWGIHAAGFTVAEVLDNPNKYVYAQYRALREVGADSIWDLMGFHAESEAMGSVLKISADALPSVADFAIKDLARDVPRLKPLDPHKDGRLPQMLKVVRNLKELVRNDVPVIGYVQGPFRHAAMLRETTKLLVEMKKNRAGCEELLNIATESLICYGSALVEAGADLIMIAEPYLGRDMMSKAMAVDLAKYFTRLTLSLRNTGARVFLHLCGDFNDMFDIIKDMGMHGVSLDESNDLARARKIMGPKVCLIGNVSPSATLSFGTSKQVRDESNAAIDAAGKDGAFILASGCLVPEVAPRENLQALIQAAMDYTY